MKNLFVSLILLWLSTAIAQQQMSDVTIEKILQTKNDAARIEALHNYFQGIMDNDPTESMRIAQELLRKSQQRRDNPDIAFALSQIGYQSFLAGNLTKCIEYNINALKIAEPTGNHELIAIAKNRIGIGYTLDPAKQIKWYREAESEVNKTNDCNLAAIVVGNIGRAYLRNHQPDSALLYLQKSESLEQKSKFKYSLAITYSSIAEAQAELKNPVLAKAYFKMAIEKAEESNSARWKNNAYNAVAKFYFEQNKKDSAIYYASKAIQTVENTPFSTLVMKPAKLLTDIYRGHNNDLAMKYFDMYAAANDKVYSFKTVQETQLLNFDEGMRQQKLAEEKARLAEERRNLIQYALIATGIVTFFILFFILSRTVIANERWISFLAILALLLVFEFINLLIHPFIEKITHHSPVLMLLALVALASLLIPLHHRLEHFIKHRLTEKNKAIRLAAAKKTIEQLNKN